MEVSFLMLGGKIVKAKIRVRIRYKGRVIGKVS
jgi:hypothetical protein